MWLSYCMGIGSYYAAKKVKSHKSYMSDPVLNIIAEDPEVEHIASEMEEPSMKEHRGEYGEQGMDRLALLKGQQAARNCAVCQGYVLLSQR